jgi:hypothetical protein
MDFYVAALERIRSNGNNPNMRLLENQRKKLDAYSVIVTDGITKKEMIIIKR